MVILTEEKLKLVHPKIRRKLKPNSPEIASPFDSLERHLRIHLWYKFLPAYGPPHYDLQVARFRNMPIRGFVGEVNRRLKRLPAQIPAYGVDLERTLLIVEDLFPGKVDGDMVGRIMEKRGGRRVAIPDKRDTQNFFSRLGYFAYGTGKYVIYR